MLTWTFYSDLISVLVIPFLMCWVGAIFYKKNLRSSVMDSPLHPLEDHDAMIAATSPFTFDIVFQEYSPEGRNVLLPMF